MPLGRLLGFSEPLFIGVGSCRFDEGVSTATGSGSVIRLCDEHQEDIKAQVPRVADLQATLGKELLLKCRGKAAW